jgi:hypothetical protein
MTLATRDVASYAYTTISAAGGSPQPTDRARQDAGRNDIDTTASATMVLLSHVRRLDMNDRICTATTCEAVGQGLVVYMDNNHLTDAFVRTLTPAIDSGIAVVKSH